MKTKETIWSNIIKLGNNQCAISIFIMNDLETVAVTYLYSKRSVFSCCFESLKRQLAVRFKIEGAERRFSHYQVYFVLSICLCVYLLTSSGINTRNVIS